MINFRFIIQYDGTRYRGWQRQKGDADTIQGRIEYVLSRLAGREVTIDGAGRTDAGVHAYAQVANARMPDSFTADQLQRQMNEYLPEDIRILKVVPAGERFHSRLHATGKVYQYCITKAGHYDVFRRKYSWQMDESLDLASMQSAADLLIGQHDFAGYCTRASKKKSTVRRLERIEMEQTDDRILLTYHGDGFLYNMVRILTGTLVEVGLGQRTIEEVQRPLQTGDRSLAGQTAPACGLFLKEVTYD